LRSGWSVFCRASSRTFSTGNPRALATRGA
jgi:hypothetical protein